MSSVNWNTFLQEQQAEPFTIKGKIDKVKQKWQDQTCEEPAAVSLALFERNKLTHIYMRFLFDVGTPL